MAANSTRVGTEAGSQSSAMASVVIRIAGVPAVVPVPIDLVPGWECACPTSDVVAGGPAPAAWMGGER